jgi:hypothetical protein
MGLGSHILVSIPYTRKISMLNTLYSEVHKNDKHVCEYAYFQISICIR